MLGAVVLSTLRSEAFGGIGRSDGFPMNRFRQFVLRHFWWLGMIAAGALLTVHSLGIRAITVDTTSLCGVGFILLCPWMAALKRIEIGAFEAEIDPAEVKRLTADISKALPELQQEATATPLGISAAVEAVRQLAVGDPGIARAELRIELERTLRRLHARTRQPASSPGNASLTKIIRDLAAKLGASSEPGGFYPRRSGNLQSSHPRRGHPLPGRSGGRRDRR